MKSIVVKMSRSLFVWENPLRKAVERKGGNSDIFPTRVYARAFPSDVGLFAVTSVTRGETMVYEFCKMQRLEMCSFGACDSKKRMVKAIKR